MPIILSPVDYSADSSSPSTIQEAITANALGPASVTISGQTVTSKDIGQLIEADRFLKSQQAAKRPGHGLRLQTFKPVY